MPCDQSDVISPVIYCKKLNIPPEGPLRVSDCGYHNGAQCLFSCAIGHRLRGSSASRCISVDEGPSGIWSNPLPSCEGKIKCILSYNYYSRST